MSHFISTDMKQDKLQSATRQDQWGTLRGTLCLLSQILVMAGQEETLEVEFPLISINYQMFCWGIIYLLSHKTLRTSHKIHVRI